VLKRSHLQSDPALAEVERDDYRVYMAVVSACLGKRVCVSANNVMVRTLEKCIRDKGGVVKVKLRTFEVIVLVFLARLPRCLHVLTCMWQTENAESFSIRGWPSLWACANEISAIVPFSPKWKSTSLDLAPAMIPPVNWKNDVSVTSKGSIVTRISWDSPIEWDDKASHTAINACNVIAYVVQNCC
jgi:hypothetical protein